MRGVWLALGAFVAAALSETLRLWPLTFLIAAAAALGLGLALIVRRPAAAALLAGICLLSLRAGVGLFLEPDVAPLAVSTGGRWSAEVLSLGSPRDGEQRAILQLDEGTAAAQVRVYASLPRYPAVFPGDRIEVEGVLRPPPEETGFGAYLSRNRIAGTLAARGLDRAGPKTHRLEGLRRLIDERLAAILPEPHAGLASAILVGLRERVDRSLAADFTASGISHVVAISGWNICLVAGLVAALGRSLSRRKRTASILAVVALYTLLAGASASVVRAALMAGVVLSARESGRRGGAAAALGLAALLMLVVEPATALDAGFQLSVAATGGLLAWGSGASGLLARRLPRAPRWLHETLGISLAAQAATLPVVLLAFGRLSLVSPLANLLVAPVVAPAMLVAFIALIASSVVAMGGPSALGLLAGTAGWAVLGAMIAIADLAASVPLASVELPEPWGLVAAALCTAALGAVGTRRGRTFLTSGRRLHGTGGRVPTAGGPATGRRLPTASGPSVVRRSPTSSPAGRPAGSRLERRAALLGIAAGAVLLGTIGLAAAARPEPRLQMTVLDVGQGDAVLLEGARGGRLLVDGGPDPDRLLRLLDGRLPPWDRRIDVLVLTHPHEDHVAGLALLLERYDVAVVAEPGMLGPGPGYAAFMEVLRQDQRPLRRLAAGDRLMLDGARVEVRWPLAGTVRRQPADEGTGINNVSIVLDIRYGARRLLLNGDVEEEVDPALLSGGVGGQVDVLKVAHHGSRTASTAAFLAAVRPRVAIVSAGAGNRYGHPAPETIERLAASGARVLRTDQDGSVTVSTDGHDLRVSASGAPPAAARAGPGEETLTAVRTAALPSSSSTAPLPRDVWLCGIPLGARAAA